MWKQMVFHDHDHYYFAFDPMKVHERHWVLIVEPFSATVIHLVEILFLRAAYLNDWLSAPVLVFEKGTMEQTNSMVELNEIEEWALLVYLAFAPFLFELNLPAFQPTPIPIVLLFQL
jgi:hypothetical protein